MAAAWHAQELKHERWDPVRDLDHRFEDLNRRPYRAACLTVVGEVSDQAGRAAERDISDEIVAMHPRLERFAMSLTRDPEAAADLAQETVVKALAARWRFEPGTNLKAWLFRILRNLHLNLLRSRANGPTLVSIEDLGAEPAAPGHSTLVEAQVIMRMELNRVAEAYGSLPPLFAIPLHLTAVEELSYAEVAAILDIPIGTVMSRVHRGRRLLIARLGDDWR